MFRVAIVGAGQIGSRHLQAMSQFDQPVSLSIVDPDPSSLATAEQRYAQCTPTPQVMGVEYLRTVTELPSIIDVLIVATSAHVRRAVMESVLAHATVRTAILEKVLFQRIEDIDAVETLIAQHGVRTVVNCPLRMVEGYQTLRARLMNARRVDLSVTGANIGIGCNSIHYLDLVAYLSGTTAWTLSSEMLDSLPVASKRSGFLEITGTLSGVSARGDRFAVTSYPDGSAPTVVQITTPTTRAIIRDRDSRAWIAMAERDWMWEDVPLVIPYQSQLTQVAVGQLLRTGTAGPVALTPYTDSAVLHRALLTTLLGHLRQHTDFTGTTCPIT